MKINTALATLVLSLMGAGLLVTSLNVQAQQNSSTAIKPPKKSTVKPLAKPASIPAAPAEQLELSKSVLTGKIDCELGAHITVEQHAKHPGYIDVRHQKHEFVMKPVMSSTGALRLEDVKGVGLMLQIANKSMLMNVKSGQRMVDGCEHPEQKALMERINRENALNPPEKLFK
jgi:hypothetical protein